MRELKIEMSNCYGISAINETLDFSTGNNPNNPKSKSYAIYAPNGLMKTSFTRSFEALSKGQQPKEERYNRQSVCIIESDNSTLLKENIYVLKSDVDISLDNGAATNILVNNESKSHYDSLVKELLKIKSKLLSALQKKSRVKKNDIEQFLMTDFNSSDFISSVKVATEIDTNQAVANLFYDEIFSAKNSNILKSQEFTEKADEYNSRYQELFDKNGSIYRRGIFNPSKADNSFSSLNKNGFFESGHKVHFSGEEQPVDGKQLEEKVKAIHEVIDRDEALKKIRTELSKNTQTQAFGSLFERLSSEEIDYLLQRLRSNDEKSFKQELWAYYIQNTPETGNLISTYETNKAEIDRIESLAAEEAPKWSQAIELFNDRFVDMPFTLSLFNQADATLGKEEAKLKFTFNDGKGEISCTREEIKALSQGEMRALYLLNFIFEVEDRKQKEQETLFIIDDAADSFDYKNKHAIVQYLKDLTEVDFFSQIILTHNFDFFRTLANSKVVDRERCLMANRANESINLSVAQGVKNYFVGVWKQQVARNNTVLCATVPFTRNIIEYTKGTRDPDYLKLTSLLHWKVGTLTITVADYVNIYNEVFGTSHPATNDQTLVSLFFDKADEISSQNEHDGLNLENKVLLSIAIRLQAELFLVEQIRTLKNDPEYWCEKSNQFAVLLKTYATEKPNCSSLKSLEKVSITVSSNIHLNSFMYEPILDLSIEHLIELYDEIRALNNLEDSSQVPTQAAAES